MVSLSASLSTRLSAWVCTVCLFVALSSQELDASGHGFLNSAEWWEVWKASLSPPRQAYSAAVAELALGRAVAFLRSNL
jgi:hypothetical protein